MKLLEVIESINTKQKNKSHFLLQFDCGKDLFRNILKEYGFIHDNKKKIYFFTGEGDPIDIDLEPIIRERQKKQNNKKANTTTTTPRKPPVKKDDVPPLPFTDHEIKILKELVSMKDEIGQLKEAAATVESNQDLIHEFAQLPPRKAKKKASYEISNDTHEQFETFAAAISDKHRMSKNDLLEIALIRMMKDFA